MDRDRFWEIIECARKGNDDLSEREEALRNTLSELSPEQLESFSSHFTAVLNEAYTWKLWGAVYLILGGMSDDGFWDFRSSLISLGRDCFYRILEQPDEIAALPSKEKGDNLFGQGFQSVDDEVYRDKTGSDLPDTTPVLDDPTGEPWSEDDVDFLRIHYPRLFAAHSWH